MPRSAATILLLLIAAATLSSCSSRSNESGPPLANTDENAVAWHAWADLAEAGFSETRLNSAREASSEAGSAAIMIVSRGLVVDAWGDVTYEFNTHSIRKSLVNALYGIALDEGTIDIDTRLAELDIDGFDELTDTEKQATVRDLLSARSGIYRPAAYEAPVHAQNRPERGSAGPGERWYYNNWDFNVAGVIWEHMTGRSLFEAFDELIATPLGMEDYEPNHGFLIFEPRASEYPAQLFRMSARDLARFGQLYLDHGTYGESQIIPPGWVETSTSTVSDLDGGTGYGLLWWTYEAGAFPHLEHLNEYDFYAADGAGGQRVAIIPQLDLVVVHRGDTDSGQGVSEADTWTVIDRVVAAREFEPVADAATVRWSPDEHASSHFEDPTIRLPEARVDELLGRYQLPGGMTARVFRFQNRVFINIGDRMEAQIEPVSPSEFIVPQFPGDGVRFEQTDGVLNITIDAAGRTMSGVRVSQDSR